MSKLTERGKIVVGNPLPFVPSNSVDTKRSPLTKWLVLVGLILFAEVIPVGAMTIHVTYDSSVTSLTNAAQVEAAVASAVQTFQDLYTNAITVNITVAFSSSVGLGQSQTEELGNPTYSDLINALSASRTTGADSNSVANLPLSDPTGGGTWWIPTAEIKALGGVGFVTLDPNDPGQDGQVTFASTVSYTLDPSNRVVSGKWDFIGVVEHEISEVLGRSYSLNVGGGGYIPYDLFRYTGSGVQSLNANDGGVYFSINDGVKSLKAFNPPGPLGGDLQDWASSATPDSYDAFLASGQKAILSSADLTALDILGYDLNFHPPHVKGVKLGNGNFQLSFTNVPGLGFQVLASTNIALSVTNWTVLGAPNESPAGQYQFTDSAAPANQKRFYRVSLP